MNRNHYFDELILSRKKYVVGVGESDTFNSSSIYFFIYNFYSISKTQMEIPILSEFKIYYFNGILKVTFDASWTISVTIEFSEFFQNSRQTPA